MWRTMATCGDMCSRRAKQCNVVCRVLVAPARKRVGVTHFAESPWLHPVWQQG